MRARQSLGARQVRRDRLGGDGAAARICDVPRERAHAVDVTRQVGAAGDLDPGRNGVADTEQRRVGVGRRRKGDGQDGAAVVDIAGHLAGLGNDAAGVGKRRRAGEGVGEYADRAGVADVPAEGDNPIRGEGAERIRDDDAARAGRGRDRGGRGRHYVQQAGIRDVADEAAGERA